jgi:hypothetical protein
MVVKFVYSEKDTKFCEIFPLLLSCVVPVKSKVKISQNFVAFSEYMNFKSNRAASRPDSASVLRTKGPLHAGTHPYTHTGTRVFVYVVVGISNSVLSILTANFPVRIEKKKLV